MKPTPEMIDAALSKTPFIPNDGNRAWMAEALSAALSAATSATERDAVVEPVAVPVPRGGLEPNWWEEWQKIVRKYRRLEKAARFVVSETDRIHDNEPWPLKYHAPYEAITQLRDVLDVVPSAPDGWQPIDTAPKDGTKILVWSGFWDKHHLVRWNQGENAWCEGSWCFGSVPDMVWMPLPTPPALGGSHE